jgi:hypothetical protein
MSGTLPRVKAAAGARKPRGGVGKTAPRKQALPRLSPVAAAGSLPLAAVPPSSSPSPLPSPLLSAVHADPFALLKSPFGGRASPADEWAALSRELSACPTLLLDGKAEGHVAGSVGAIVAVATSLDAAQLARGVAGVAARVVALDVLNSSLDDTAASRLVGASPWLRQLRLMRNPSLLRPPSLASLAKLLCLELCHCPLGVAGLAGLCAAPQLRRLVVDSCGVSSLPECVFFPELRILDVRGNVLTDFGGACAWIEKHKRLEELHLMEGNPFEPPGQALHSAVVAFCTRALPCLVRLEDAPFLRQGAAAAVVAAADVAAGVGGEDASSCSCLFGNACMSAYACLNWDARYEVAAAARQARVACTSAGAPTTLSLGAQRVDPP